MSESRDHRETWLVAVWPGMGNVAVGAGSHLIAGLGAALVHELAARDLFDINNVEVKAGLVEVGRFPRCIFFEWKDPRERRDLLIFVGEAQPVTGGYALCHRIIDFAIKRGVSRVFTFAAMATQLHPSDEPRVFGVATAPDSVEELRRLEVQILEEGQIGGLNGVLLAAAAERDLVGSCLLGEMPYFAVGVPNPRASQAVLEVFSAMLGIDLDLSELIRQGKAVEKGLLELMEKMQEAANEQGEGEAAGFSVPEVSGTAGDDEDERSGGEGVLDDAIRLRIEAMFAEARQDRSRAFQLKAELDRLGIFEQFEDRFLDLFKHAD